MYTHATKHSPSLWKPCPKCRIETICSDPYAVKILSNKPTLSRQAILNSMAKKNTNTNPKMIRDSTTEKVVAAGSRKSRNRRRAARSYEDEMDVYQAKLINWEIDQNFERRDVIFEENEPTMDEVVHGEYLRTIFPSFREKVGGMALGGVVSDQELRDMGLLYDSEDEYEHEHVMETQTPTTPVACTPYMVPRSPVSESGLLELWELMEAYGMLPGKTNGESDVLSEWDTLSEWDVLSEC